MEKLEIPSEKAIKLIILKFVSYAIFCCFILTFFSFLYSYILSSISASHVITVTACISLMLAIGIFYLSHLLCRASTFDTFKLQKISKESEKVVLRRLNACFMLFVIFSFVFSFFILKYSINSLETAAEISIGQLSSTFSEDYTKDVTNKIMDRLQTDKTAVFIQYFILECSIVVSSISLVPYQKKMLKLYNK